MYYFDASRYKLASQATPQSGGKEGVGGGQEPMGKG